MSKYKQKRVTFLTGYYGSGKTELAMNLAIKNQVDYVVDLDIINPYFRTRELEKLLASQDIETISSGLDGLVHLDMPYISKKVFIPLNQENKTSIYDLGGNDQGAKLMRQFDDYHDIDYDLLLVVNIFRTETDEATKIIQLVNRIEGMSGFKVTGLINNSNLLKETTSSEILAGQAVVEEVSDRLNIPIVYTSYYEKIDIKDMKISNEILKIHLYFRENWL